MWKTIINLLFPIYCLGCEQEGKFICSACFGKIKINKKYYFDKADILKKTIVTGYHQDELLKQAIYKYKYNFIKDLSKPLGQLMINKMLKDIKKKCNFKKFILIPIPLHFKRLRWRGFNQAELLAQIVSQELNIPVINNLLIRTKHTLPQVKIQKAFQRRQNIHNVFDLVSFPRKRESSNKLIWIPNPSRGGQTQVGNDKSIRRPIFNANNFKNKTFILVDDISTTGATLGEAARILNALNPKQIWGLVLTKD